MSDTAFTGSIPDQYENGLVPILFAPYSADMAQRVAVHNPASILELAAGTGATTREMIARLPSAAITMTDLNPGMLETAMRVLGSSSVTAQACDATALPFADGSYAAVVATFGVMFFPDRVAAYREAKRVLADGGTLHFNAWGSLAANPQIGLICSVYKEAVGVPCFLERVPFSYCNHERIESDLRAAGFSNVAITDVQRSTNATSANHFLAVLGAGSPFAADFDQLGNRADGVRDAIIEALKQKYGTKAITNEMSAVVVEARA